MRVFIISLLTSFLLNSCAQQNADSSEGNEVSNEQSTTLGQSQPQGSGQLVMNGQEENSVLDSKQNGQMKGDTLVFTAFNTVVYYRWSDAEVDGAARRGDLGTKNRVSQFDEQFQTLNTWCSQNGFKCVASSAKVIQMAVNSQTTSYSTKDLNQPYGLFIITENKGIVAVPGFMSTEEYINGLKAYTRR